MGFPVSFPEIARDKENEISSGKAVRVRERQVVTMPVQAIFWMEQERVCAGAVVQGRQVRVGSKGKRIGRGEDFE